MNTISLNAVVKNEINRLPRMLESVKHIAKEIVIVDTGSTDGTVEFLRNYPKVTLIEHPLNKWTGDLCVESRNMALKKATHPWVLTLDADEELSPSLSSEIATFVNNTDKDSMFLKRANFLDKKPTAYDSRLALVRTKKYKWTNFKGRWHEILSVSESYFDAGNSSKSYGMIFHFGWYNLSELELNYKKELYEDQCPRFIN